MTRPALYGLLDLAAETLRLIPSPDAALRRARVRGRLAARRARLLSRIAVRPTPAYTAALARVEAIMAALSAEEEA